MEWIVTNGNGIVCSKDELAARREFIGMITGVSPSRWHIIVKDINNRFYYKCNTIDDINGLFITGHVGEVWEICKSPVLENLILLLQIHAYGKMGMKSKFCQS